ncbi:MAG: hypothetical protein ACRC35_01530, partial [Angustibacter sp.]
HRLQQAETGPQRRAEQDMVGQPSLQPRPACHRQQHQRRDLGDLLEDGSTVYAAVIWTRYTETPAMLAYP